MKDLKYNFLKRLYKQCKSPGDYVIFEDFRKTWPKCPDLPTVTKHIDPSLFQAVDSHYNDFRDAKLSIKPSGVEWVKNERTRKTTLLLGIVAAVAAVVVVILTILFHFFP